MRFIAYASLLAVTFLAWLLPVNAASITVVHFDIDDTVPAQSGLKAGVFSDQLEFPPIPGTATNSYADYRLDPQNALNYCVDAAPYAPGNLFVRLNRNLDGDSGTQRCDLNGGTPRQFRLQIDNVEACAYLSNAYGTDLFDTAGGIYTGTPPCVLPKNDNPRIRLDTLYKSKAKSTNIDFLTIIRDSVDGLSYEIRSDAPTAILASGTMKTVDYSGVNQKFHLVEFRPGLRAKTVGPGFRMPVRMTFWEFVLQ